MEKLYHSNSFFNYLFFEIISNKKLADITYEMVLSGDCSDITKPGQFVNLKLDGLYLRRPISVCDVEGDVLTVYYKDAILSYGFTNDIEIAYNAVEKTFSVAKVKTYNYANSRDAYIYDYVAAVKVDAPAGEATPIEKFAGDWKIF